MREVIRIKKAAIGDFSATHMCPLCGEFYSLNDDDEALCDWWDCDWYGPLNVVILEDDTEEDSSDVKA